MIQFKHAKELGQFSLQNHLFYLDPDRNREYPTWFFNECSRDEAESVLTVGRQFGNVMMRTSSSFSSTGKYVISMRREIAGGTTLYHYEVAKHSGTNGFKINVDNQHSPMRCLSEVMDFFVSVAGPGTLTMKTNSKDRIFNKSGSSFNQAPRGGLDNDSGAPFASNNNWSSGADSRHLHVSGMVDPTISSTVSDMNTQFVRRDSSTRLPPSNQGWPAEDYQNVPSSMHGNSIDQFGRPVDEGGVGREAYKNPHHHGNHDGFTNTGRGYHSDRHSNPSGFNSHGSGGSDRSSSIGHSAPPPPGPPPLPDMNRMSLGSGGGRPGGGGGSRFPPSGPSFEDELKQKLRAKKEEIYATATILTSNS